MDATLRKGMVNSYEEGKEACNLYHYVVRCGFPAGRVHKEQRSAGGYRDYI